MDNHDEHIDEIFRSRFEGLKDHSIDPASQWDKLEAGLSGRSESHIGGESLSSGITSGWAVAASVSVLIASSVIFSGDTTDQIVFDDGAIEPNTIALEPPIDEASERNTVLFEVDKSDESALSSAGKMKSSDQSTLLANDISIKDGASSSTNGSDGGQAGSDLVVASVSPAGNLAGASSSVNSSRNNTSVIDLNDLSPMKSLGLGYASNEALVDQEATEYRAPKGERWVKRPFVMARAGLRSGLGDNNTARPNDLFINGFAGVGFGYRISESVSIQSEIIYTRRSGQNIERKKQHDISQLLSFVGNTYNATAQSSEVPDNVKIDESLIATRTDWIQLPITVSVKATDRVAILAGGYLEYMISVNNESYLVYNETEYVSTSLLRDNKNDRVALNSLRYGSTVGASVEIMDRLSADARLLLNVSPTTVNQEEYTAAQMNGQSFDFQLGVTYQL